MSVPASGRPVATAAGDQAAPDATAPHGTATRTPDAAQDPVDDQWRTYDDFSAGIDTYRLPNTDLQGTALAVTLDDGTTLRLAFAHDAVTWSATGGIRAAQGTTDPYDAVAVRDDVVFVNLPLTSRDGEALTVVHSTRTHRALVVVSHIAERERPDTPRVHQRFLAGTTNGGPATGDAPAPSRDLIGTRNVYRYSPQHLYEHVYLSSRRYSWQCLQGVQRGHGDTDLSTVWKFQDGLYVFCFREFRIPVASVWLHDLGYQLMTTGVFLGLDAAGRTAHARGGGHIYPLGSVSYPDVQPV